MRTDLRGMSCDDHDEFDDSPPLLAATERMSCLINNRNYADYLCEAVQSAIEQECAYDEIIVVDDGSTDESLQRLRRRFGGNPRLQVVAKEHGGQLSCIQTAVECATGDLLFFLDSDDRQSPTLTHEVSTIFSQRPSVNFVSVGFCEFGNEVGHRCRRATTRDRGMSTVATILQREWVGAPTSCLSMRASLVKQFLPYTRDFAWKTRADDVLVYGSSIFGAHKYHLERPLIEYRLHGENHFAGRTWSAIDKMHYALEVNRLTKWYVEQLGYEPTTLAQLAAKEFRTIERPRMRELLRYLRMTTRSRAPWDVQLIDVASLFKHFAVEKASRRPEPLAAAGAHPAANPAANATQSLAAA